MRSGWWRRAPTPPHKARIFQIKEGGSGHWPTKLGAFSRGWGGGSLKGKLSNFKENLTKRPPCLPGKKKFICTYSEHCTKAKSHCNDLHTPSSCCCALKSSISSKSATNFFSDYWRLGSSKPAPFHLDWHQYAHILINLSRESVAKPPTVKLLTVKASLSWGFYW